MHSHRRINTGIENNKVLNQVLETSFFNFLFTDLLALTNTAVKCLRMRTESVLCIQFTYENIHPAKMLEVFCNL